MVDHIILYDCPKLGKEGNSRLRNNTEGKKIVNKKVDLIKYNKNEFYKYINHIDFDVL